MRLLGQRWRVNAVGDGEAALAAARSTHIDLVLTDAMMPRLDGFGLLRALRADPALNSVPVIMLSARAGEESRLEGLQHGADDYLIKPFSAREVLARVQVHLRRAQAEAKLRVSLAEQQALLRELNHRVKNNLEVINSLLSLHAGYTHDAHEQHVLAELSNRVRAIATVHRLLYDVPTRGQVDLGSFAEELAQPLFAFYGVGADRVRFDVHAERVGIDLQRAVPLGLLINELLSNALQFELLQCRACVRPGPSYADSIAVVREHPAQHFDDVGVILDNQNERLYCLSLGHGSSSRGSESTHPG